MAAAGEVKIPIDESFTEKVCNYGAGFIKFQYKVGDTPVGGTSTFVQRGPSRPTLSDSAMTGAAGLSDELPFGRILADLMAARQHISNQYDYYGSNWGAAMFGLESKDFLL